MKSGEREEEEEEEEVEEEEDTELEEEKENRVFGPVCHFSGGAQTENASSTSTTTTERVTLGRKCKKDRKGQGTSKATPDVCEEGGRREGIGLHGKQRRPKEKDGSHYRDYLLYNVPEGAANPCQR